MRKKEIESLEDRNKILHGIMTNKLLNKGYLARMIYDVEVPSSLEAKRATSKLNQKLNGKSSISNEEMLKMYKLLKECILPLSDKIISIKTPMENLMRNLMEKNDINSLIKVMTKEEIQTIIKKVKENG